MTGTFSPPKSVEEAKADVGFHEGSNNWNPYSLWQYGNPNNPYCNSATCKWAYDAGFRFWPDCTYGSKGEAYTPTYAQRARAHGVWRDKHYKASPGDDVEFDWGNNGLIDHVEKVVADDGVTIITIGANTSSGVYYRRRDRTYVSNFVALTQAGQNVPVQPPFKVRPMYDPARKLRAVLQHPEGKGCWLGFESGLVTFVYANPSIPPRAGGMISGDDRKHFQGRILARLVNRTWKEDGETKHGYTIIATSGEKYVPESQK